MTPKEPKTPQFGVAGLMQGKKDFFVEISTNKEVTLKK
jgi:hypothetical protein